VREGKGGLELSFVAGIAGERLDAGAGHLPGCNVLA
jgi:hypothetical protein